MQVELYKYEGKPNVLYKTLGDPVFTLKGELRNPITIKDPVITFAGNLAEYIKCNYAYIKDFNRYYFIDSVTSMADNLVEISFHLDTLTSYADNIFQGTAYVNRASKLYDTKIADNQRSFLGTYNKEYYYLQPKDEDYTGSYMPVAFIKSNQPRTPFIFPGGATYKQASPYSGNPYVVIYKDSSDAVRRGFTGNVFKTYTTGYHQSVITNACGDSVAGLETDDMGHGGLSCISVSYGDLIKILHEIDYRSDDTKGVVAIRKYPLGLSSQASATDKVSTINLGGTSIALDNSYTMDGITFQVADFNWSSSGTYNYSKWRLNQYDKYRLWLPYCGWLEFDMNIISNIIDTYKDAHIQVQYIANPYDGTATAFVTEEHSGILLLEKNFTFGTMIALATSNIEANSDLQRKSNTNGAITALVGLGTILATLTMPEAGVSAGLVGLSGVAGIAKGITTPTLTALSRHDSDTVTTGSAQENSYRYSGCIIEVTYFTPTFPDYEVSGEEYYMQEYINNTGLPVQKERKLSNFDIKNESVYFMATDSIIPLSYNNLSMTKDDLEEITGRLAGGVYSNG